MGYFNFFFEVNSLTMLFFYLITLFCGSNAVPLGKMTTNIKLSNKTEAGLALTYVKKKKNSFKGRDFLSEIKSNPKKFMSEAQKLDPGSVAEVISLLEALLESSRTRENDLLTDMNNKQEALDNSNNALISAEDALDQANAALANEQAARDDHTAKTDEHGAAEQLYNDEIGGLDDEQQVLEQVIAMMQGLLEEAPSPSPPQITE